jgi:hypothetical protein
MGGEVPSLSLGFGTLLWECDGMVNVPVCKTVVAFELGSPNLPSPTIFFKRCYNVI